MARYPQTAGFAGNVYARRVDACFDRRVVSGSYLPQFAPQGNSTGFNQELS
jgi:hypothetical protein